MCSMKCGSRFILLNKWMSIFSSTYCLLTRLYFIHWIVFALFFENELTIYVALFLDFLLFWCVSVCVLLSALCFCLDYCIFVVSPEIRYSVSSKPPSPFTGFRDWVFQLRRKGKRLNMSLMTPPKDKLLLTVNSFSLCT